MFSILNFIHLHYKQINFCDKQINYLTTVFSKITEYGFKTFENVKPVPRNDIAKTFMFELIL